MNKKQQRAIERAKKQYLETGDVYTTVEHMVYCIGAPLPDKEWAAAVIEFLTWFKDQMEIKEGKKYNCKKTSDFQDEKILAGDVIGVNHIELPIAYCDVYREDEGGVKRCRTIEINRARLEQLIDFESEATYYGECEECRCMLSEYPEGAWGVGYVCAPCAKKLRGEYEL